MSIFIGYMSAYEFWRMNDMLPNDAPSRAHPQPIESAKDKRSGTEVLASDAFDKPLHLVVATANDRIRTKDLRYHVWSGSFPPGSFVRLRRGVHLSSPDRSFFEMASELSLIELVRYGFTLCSGYAYDDNDQGFRKRNPLTTVQSLARYAENAGNRHGAKKAARALRFVANASASPMETNLTMSLCLPRMLGGYGLELPELNLRIQAKTKGLVGRDHFACDLYWRRQRIAVEYDSRLHHSGTQAETNDSARRSALLTHGITAVSITPEQFFDARKLDEAARAVAKLIGQRLPENDPHWMMKRYELRAQLLRDMQRNPPKA